MSVIEVEHLSKAYGSTVAFRQKIFPRSAAGLSPAVLDTPEIMEPGSAMLHAGDSRYLGSL